MSDKYYKNKNILITGGAGSIGKSLVLKLLRLDPNVIRVLDINETELYKLDRDLNSNLIRLFIGDIRDQSRVNRATEDVDIVFHTAALKHVSLCEYNPFEAILTNVMGTQCLLDASIKNNVEKFITISTDKAVNPINVMGATKLLSERLTLAANNYKGKKRTIFSCVRFGNVLGTRGSVLPTLLDSLRTNKLITITDEKMTRFVMTIDLAIQFILDSCKHSIGGEIFVKKMPSLYIKDLAEVLIDMYCEENDVSNEEIIYKIIGKKTGEKLHEELMTIYEANKSYENEYMYVIPQEDSSYNNILINGTFKKVSELYTSKEMTKLTKPEIYALINDIIKI